MTYQASQADLFGVEPDLPTGLQYEPDLVSSKEEQRLIEQFTKLPFKEFEFQGFRWQAPYCLLRLELRLQWRRSSAQRGYTGISSSRT